MAADDSIPLFPADIDRDAFGHWLSGFTDGEGYFRLGMEYGQPRATFCIKLRRDDGTVLGLILAYLRCGRLVARPATKSKSGIRGNPQTEFRVDTVSPLAAQIVPHFDHYPLRAKKARDFLLWRQGVLWLAGQYRGHQTRYTAEERAWFREQVEILRTQRLYEKT